jgi:hypothetical protein
MSALSIDPEIAYRIAASTDTRYDANSSRVRGGRRLLSPELLGDATVTEKYALLRDVRGSRTGRATAV